MKIIITVPYSAAIVLDAEFASVAATLLTNARAVKGDGYGRDTTYGLHEEGLALSWIEDNKVTAVTDREKSLAEQLSKTQSESWKHQSAGTTKDKRIQELEAQLALLERVTVCNVVPEPSQESTEDNDEIF